jgi:hypothetical protein
VTWRDLILYGPGWLALAALLASRPLACWHYRRTQRRYEARWGVPYDGP